MYIEILSYMQSTERRLQDLKDIFYLDAKADISTPDKKEKLYDTYAKPYVANWPSDVFFACHLDNHRTMGYLTGCRDSNKATSILSENQKSYLVFEDLFSKFPAHLHMNVHPDFHGQGAGTFLLLEYIIELKKFGIHGVHIVTSPEQRNVSFYLKHKFKHQVRRSFQGQELLFMGLAL